jgi:pyruvate carboxylase subunit B
MLIKGLPEEPDKGEAKNRFDIELEAAIKVKLLKHNIEIPNIRIFKHPNAEPLFSLASGRVIWELDYFEGSSEPVHGKMIKEDEPICGLQTRYGLE